MKLEPTRKKQNRPLGFIKGAALLILAVVIFWIGLLSLMIGVAYSAAAGSFLPKLVGGILVLISLPILYNSVSLLKKSIFSSKSEDLPASYWNS